MCPIFDGSVHNFGITEEMLISHRCKRGLMPYLIKKSWTVSIIELLLQNGFALKAAAAVVQSHQLIINEVDLLEQLCEKDDGPILDTKNPALKIVVQESIAMSFNA